jgi:hypothetical protein
MVETVDLEAAVEEQLQHQDFPRQFLELAEEGHY